MASSFQEGIKPIIEAVWQLFSAPKEEGDIDFNVIPDYMKIIPVNNAFLRHICGTDFSPQQKRYLLERSHWKNDFQLQDFNRHMRHSYYDPIAKALGLVEYSVNNNFGNLQERCAEAIATIEYCNEIYGFFLGIDPDKIDDLDLPPLDAETITFPQILKQAVKATKELRSAFSEHYPGYLEEYDIASYKQRLRIKAEGISPGEIIERFNPAEWQKLQPLTARLK